MCDDECGSRFDDGARPARRQMRIVLPPLLTAGGAYAAAPAASFTSALCVIAMRDSERQPCALSQPLIAHRDGRRRVERPGLTRGASSENMSGDTRAPRSSSGIRGAHSPRLPPVIEGDGEINSPCRSFNGYGLNRDAQSIEFLRLPGIEKLYSGLAITNASLAATRSPSSPRRPGSPAPPERPLQKRALLHIAHQPPTALFLEREPQPIRRDPSVFDRRRRDDEPGRRSDRGQRNGARVPAALGWRGLTALSDQLAAQRGRDALHRPTACPAVGELQVRAQEPPGDTTGEAQIGPGNRRAQTWRHRLRGGSARRCTYGHRRPTSLAAPARLER
jgi:hypothetical protein